MDAIDRELVADLEKRCGAELNDYLQNVTLETVDHDDHTVFFSRMARREGVPLAQFSSYVRAKLYAKLRSQSFDGELDRPEDLAEQLGWEMNVLWDFLEEQSPIFDSLRIVDDYDDFRRPRQQSLLKDPWEEEEALLDDLQHDAELQGE